MNSDDDLIWKEMSRELMHRCRVFDLYKTKSRSPEGKEADFFMLKAPDWVTVIPLVKKDGRDHFLMVRQYRHGTGKVTLEFPAGTIERGEDPKETMKRELTEETGYSFGKFTYLGQVNPNPAFLNNTYYAFLAEDVLEVGQQDLDEHEHIHTRFVPTDEVIRDMGTGEYSNGTMLMGLLYYLRWKNAITLG